MNRSEELAIIYAKHQTKVFGRKPFYITADILSLAIKRAFECGYTEGEVSVLKNVHGIPEKEINNERHI